MSLINIKYISFNYFWLEFYFDRYELPNLSFCFDYVVSVEVFIKVHSQIKNKSEGLFLLLGNLPQFIFTEFSFVLNLLPYFMFPAFQTFQLFLSFLTLVGLREFLLLDFWLSSANSSYLHTILQFCNICTLPVLLLFFT